jgi:15-cis-phytoene synthase
MSIELVVPSSTHLSASSAFYETERVIRRHSKTFFFATGLLPRKIRRAIRVLYGFCRVTDDLVDQENATLEDLEKWRAQVAQEPEKQSNPLLFSWALIRKQYQIDLRFEQELIDGVKMDLQRRHYVTWTDLERYCYHVASTVGLLSLPIIGTSPGATFELAEPYAIQLGIALQLTNILRDVGEDAEHGRVYLPEEDLARFGLTVQDILHRVYDRRFIRLMQFEIARAHELYQQALPGISFLSPAVRPAVGAAALLYRAILDEIEKIHYDVYKLRAHTSTVRKLMLLPGVFATVFSLKRQE